MTPDRVASERYYTRLFGWTTREVDMAEGPPYVMFRMGDEDIAGMMQFDPAQGIPPMWMAYGTVDDVDRAAAKVTELMGSVYFGPKDIPGVGRFVVIADPAGAALAAIRFAASDDSDEGQPPRAGTFCFEQLLCPDPAAVTAFYEEIFLWTHVKYDMGPQGSYWMFKRGDRDAAGAMPKPPGSPGPAHWLSYVAVDDVDAMAARVPELGGRIFLSPSDIPGVGRLSVSADPQGATLALYKALGA
jgi:hypothetical protein